MPSLGNAFLSLSVICNDAVFFFPVNMLPNIMLAAAKVPGTIVVPVTARSRSMVKLPNEFVTIIEKVGTPAQCR
jgi:hypothetical protein